jgi:hypothetical protein
MTSSTRPPDKTDYAFSAIVVLLVFAIALVGALMGGCEALRDGGPGIAETLKDAGKITQETVGPVYRLQAGGKVCSAVAIAPDRAVTAAHCVTPETPATPYTLTHVVGGPVDVMPTKIHEDRDLAELKVVEGRLPFYAAIAPDPVEMGDVVVVVGWGCLDGKAPFSRPALVAIAALSTFDTFGAICPGDSGGAVFADGKLAGVVSASVELEVVTGAEYRGGVIVAVHGVL